VSASIVGAESTGGVSGGAVCESRGPEVILTLLQFALADHIRLSRMGTGRHIRDPIASLLQFVLADRIGPSKVGVGCHLVDV
jgi:hypothetical protein